MLKFLKKLFQLNKKNSADGALPLVSGFWKELRAKQKPFFVLAPMADVTDPAFRQIISKYSRQGQPGGGPDVMWTEFVSANGLCSPGREILKKDLEYSESERPIVAQLFSASPEHMRQASKYCAELGFDGIDINMGCPDRTIEKQGAGACMIKNPENARAIIRAAKQGVIDAGKNIPVSVKTRVGYNKVQIDEWIPVLLSEHIAALTIHARTRKEMSLVPAKWEYVKEVVELRNQIAPETVIIGNGDVKNLEEGHTRAIETGCDGIMIGRGIFGTPWLFDRDRKEAPELKERLRIMVEHTYLFEKLLSEYKGFHIMKKHYKAYVNNFDGAKELRMKLMDEAKTAKDVERIIDEFIV